MTVSSLKELKQLIQACKKLGVYQIKVDNVELTITPDRRAAPTVDLSDFPEASIKVPQYNPPVKSGLSGGSDIAQADEIDTDGLTHDQLLFYSAGSTEEQVEQ